MAGEKKGRHTFECTCSNGFVLSLTGTLTKFSLCLAWMQTVHIESWCVYPLIRVFMAVGLIWASRRCHILHSGIVTDCPADLVWVVKGALRTEEAGGFVDAIVGSIVGLIVGSAIVGSSVGFCHCRLHFTLCDCRLHCRLCDYWLDCMLCD